MAFIGESERRHLNELYEKSRNRKPSLTSSSTTSSTSSSPVRFSSTSKSANSRGNAPPAQPKSQAKNRSLKNQLRKQSSPACLPSITVTRHASFAPTPRHNGDKEHQLNRANSTSRVVVADQDHARPASSTNRRQSRGRTTTVHRISITELPLEFRARASTLPGKDNEEPAQSSNNDDDQSENLVYRRRHFDVSPKGVVTNHGDCYRPRSNSSTINSVGLAGGGSPAEYVPVTKGRLLSVSSAHSGAGNLHQERRLSLGGFSTASGGSGKGKSPSTTEDDSPTGGAPDNVQHRVLICGAEDVGKTALINQFLSSEHTNVYEYNKADGARLEKTVSILLDGQESDLNFIDASVLDYGCHLSEAPPADAYLLIYNVTDRASFESVIDDLYDLKQSEDTREKSIILVGNKSDLVRARIVTTEEGRSIAASYDCKFVETSAALSDHVDELLVGILKQIRLKEGQCPAKKHKHRKLRYKRHDRKDKNTLVHTYEKACDLLAKLISKNHSKSCGNLYVL